MSGPHIQPNMTDEEAGEMSESTLLDKAKVLEWIKRASGQDAPHTEHCQGWLRALDVVRAQVSAGQFDAKPAFCSECRKKDREIDALIDYNDRLEHDPSMRKRAKPEPCRKCDKYINEIGQANGLVHDLDLELQAAKAEIAELVEAVERLYWASHTTNPQAQRAVDVDREWDTVKRLLTKHRKEPT